MKKVHSLDYSASRPAGPSGSAPPVPTPVTTSGSSARPGPMLMHSVSIVVELANEAKTGRDDETGESDAKLGEGRPANEEPCESSGPTGEAPRNTDDDEEDEDDDDGECLSSDLARRVVIVDEADKIFRGRAQSAEPRVFEQRPDTPTLAGAHPRSESAQPLAPDQQQQLSRKTRHSLACPLAPALAPGGHTLGLGAGGGELAERGALIKLGMRRNTHHHVNFNPAALVMAQPPAGPSALAPASGASAQQTHPSSKSGAGGAPTKCANQVDQQQQQPRQWSLASVGHSQGGAAGATHWPFAANQHHQHRRQSLQIGRLTGACQSSRSLTEDELRGEREFNEQVRSAKSPEGFHLSSAFSANVYTNSLASRPELATRSAANLSRQQSDNQQRCQWTSGGELSSSPATDKYLATSKAGQQERAGSRGSSGGAGAPLPILHGQRRVSFSSIDPIVNRPPVAQHHQHQGQAQQRASICGTLCDQSAPAADHQVSKPQSQQEHERPGQLAERRHQDRTTTPDRGSLAQKRHSLASGAAESGAQVLGTENGHSGGAEGETRAPDGARGPARLAKEWAGAQTVHGRRTSGNWLGAGPTLVTSAAAGAQNNQVERKMSASGANSATPQTMKTSGEPTPAHRLGPAADDLSGTGATRAGDVSSSQLGCCQDLDETRQAITPTTTMTMSNNSANQKHQAKATGADKEDSRVQSIMASAKLRQEEFARLLEEHEQIVNEINRFETKISSTTGQTNTQQQRAQKQPEAPGKQ